MRNSFVFYDSYFDAIDELDEEIQLKIFRLICKYALYKEEQEMSGIEKAVFLLIKPTIDSNEKRYENSKKGGEAKAKKIKKEKADVPEKNESKPDSVSDCGSVPEKSVNQSASVSESAPAKPVSDPVLVPEINADGMRKFGTVMLKASEYESLVNAYGEAKTCEYIKKVDTYQQSVGRTFNNNYDTILKWIIQDKKKEKPDNLDGFDAEKWKIFINDI